PLVADLDHPPDRAEDRGSPGSPRCYRVDGPSPGDRTLPGCGCCSHRNSLGSCAARQDHPPRRGRTLGDHRSREGPGHLTMYRPSHAAPALMPPPAAMAVPGCRIACLLLALLCLNTTSPTAAQSPTVQARTGQEPITPIPAMPAQDPLRLVLGERLFNDRRLSHDNTHSCSLCHDIQTNGATGNAHDVTPEGRPIALNTLTIFNAALSFRLTWAGSFRSLKQEAEHTLRNPAI